MVGPLHSLRPRQAVFAGEPPGARAHVDAGRVDAAPHALRELLGRLLRVGERHPTRERHPQPIPDQCRLDVFATPSTPNQLYLHNSIYIVSVRQFLRASSRVGPTIRSSLRRARSLLATVSPSRRGNDICCYRNVKIVPHGRGDFRLTEGGRGRTVADAGSPLRRLRICHPADSERAHERPAARGLSGLRVTSRRCSVRAPARALPAPGGGGRGMGPEEIGAAMQRRLLGVFPRSGASDTPPVGAVVAPARYRRPRA